MLFKNASVEIIGDHIASLIVEKEQYNMEKMTLAIKAKLCTMTVGNLEDVIITVFEYINKEDYLL